MVLTLTMWQKKRSGLPTRAGQGKLEDPTVEAFDAAVTRVLATVEPGATGFQIVCSVGDSSRGFPLTDGKSDAELKAALWEGYCLMSAANG